MGDLGRHQRDECGLAQDKNDGHAAHYLPPWHLVPY